MTNNRLSGNQCDLCYRTSHQQRIVLSSLHSKIRKLLTQPSFSSIQHYVHQQDCEGFARLVRAVKASQPPKTKYHPHCLHLKWLRLIKRSINCSMHQLDYICHQLANKLSERNYHLYLLETQIKSVCDNCDKISTDSVEIQVKQEEIEDKRVEIEMKKVVGEGKEQVEGVFGIPTLTSLKQISSKKQKKVSENEAVGNNSKSNLT